MKKTKKHLLLVTLMVCIALCAIFSLSAAATDSTAAGGMEFSQTVYFDQKSNISPTGSITVEAELWLDPDGAYTNNPSVIFGNFKDDSTKGLDFLIRDGKYVELYRRTPSAPSQLKFSTNVRALCSGTADDPGFIKITVSVDTADGTTTLYVNGEEKESKISSWTVESSFAALQNPFRIGGDLRNATSNTKYFDGQLKNVVLYNDVRTADEVAADAAKITFSVDKSDEALLFAYDLTDTSVTGCLQDLSGYKNDAINPNTYVESVLDNGFSFAQDMNYAMEEAIAPDGSMTFEALMTLPTDNNRCGWAICNWKAYSAKTHSMGIEFEKNRVIRLYLCSANKNEDGSGTPANNSYRFKLPEETSPGTYRKVTFTINVNGDVSCYVDGDALYCCNSSGTVTEDTKYNVSSWITTNHSKNIAEFYNQATPFVIGGDYRSNNTWYLHYLKVKSIAMYKGVPADSSNVTTNDLTSMFSYDLTDTSVTGCFEDLSGNDNDAINEATYDSSRAYDYSFAIIGDTQYMTRWDAVKIDGVQNSSQHLKKVYDWLIANKDKKNIKYVMGLGDITDSYSSTYDSGYTTKGYAFDTAAEWAIAYEQISRLNGLIPYSVVRGNHDNESWFDKYFANSDADDEYGNEFYKSQFKDSAYEDNSVCFYKEEGSEEISVKTAYTKFEVGSEKYLLLLLDDNPTDDMLSWAGNVISNNPTYRVIINTHTYLGYTGDLIDGSNIYAYARNNIYEGENNGQEIWDKLVSKYENIALVVCGHDYNATNIVRRVRVGDNGNEVTEMLICPQSLDVNKNVPQKAGMVTMLYFSNNGKDIRVEYVSTADTEISDSGNDVYHNSDVNNMSMSIMQIPVESKYGYIPYEYRDADVYPFAVFNEKGMCIGASECFYGAQAIDSAICIAKTHVKLNQYVDSAFVAPEYTSTILMRRDYSIGGEYDDNISQIQGVVTIDLNGFKLTAKSSDVLIRSNMKSWSHEKNDSTVFPTELVFVNGYIDISNNPLLKFSSAIEGKESTFRFENVSFAVVGSTANFAAVHSGKSVEGLKPVMSFTDCEIDLTEATADNIVLFNLGDAYTSANIKIDGCSIIASDTSFTLYAKDDEASTGTLLPVYSDSRYNTLTIEDASVPTAAGIEFIKLSDNEDGSVTYKLKPVALSNVSYSPKMSITLESQLKINVYIPIESLQKFTFNGVTYDTSNNFGDFEKKIIEEKEYYLISLSIPAGEAAGVSTLAVTVSVGTKSAKATFSFSIPKYAEKVLEDETSTETEKALVKDVLAYIKAAYNYSGFAAHNTELEIARVNTLIESIIGDYTGEPVSSGTTKTVSPVTSVTLNLDAKPTIRFYVSDTNVTFKIGDKVLPVVKNNEEGYVELDVYAYALCEEISYGNGGSYHVSSYLAGAAGKDYEALAKAFVKYVESAATYRESVIASGN